jgi:HEAT repeat protein
MRKDGTKQKRGKYSSAARRLMRAVLGRDTLQRERAISAIVRSPSKGIVGELIDFLASTDSDLRMNGLSLLKRLGGRDLSPVLDLLKRSDPWMRMCGCEILGALRKKRTISHLIACSQDPDPNVRNAACIALGEFRDDDAVEALLSALQDEEWIAFSAAYSLGKIGSSRALPYLWKVFVEKNGVLALIACEVLLGSTYRHVWRDLFLVLRGWSEQRRDMFIRMVLEKEVPAVLDELYEALDDDLFSHLARHLLADGKWSPELMGLLARFKRPETCDMLFTALGKLDEDTDEFDDLLLLFAGLHDVWQCSAEAFLQSEPQALLPFIRACGISRHQIPVETIDRLFTSAPLTLKRVLVQQLPLIAGGDATALLLKALNDEDGHVKGDAALAASRLGLKDLTEEIANISIDGFLDVRKKGLQALVTLDAGRGAELIEKLARSKRSEDRKVALTMVDQLDKEQAFRIMQVLLEDPDESVARSAICAAGSVVQRDSRYLRLFDKLLAERPVVHELLRVIREQRLDAFRDSLVQLFFEQGSIAWTRYQVLTALAALRDHSLLDVFVGALRDESALIKIGSIKALSDLGDATAIAYVGPFMKSQDVALRSAASAAVKELRRLEPGKAP